MAENITEEMAQTELDRSTSEIEHEIIASQRRAIAAGSPAEGSIRDLKNLNSSAIKEITRSNLEKDREALFKIVCQQLHYCKVSKSQPAAMVLAFIDAVIDAHIPLLASFPVPAVTATAYMIKAGLLDDFCQCKAKK